MLKIYKASAGSGKTYRLAKEYIKMLLGVKAEDGTWKLRRSNSPDSHRNILAITFTNKATEEMKKRILHELARLGGCEPGWDDRSPYRDDLMMELHCSSEELSKAASKALTGLVMDYNFFNVSTIDSFFQVVLRAFAREAQVLGDYEVDLDSEGQLKNAVGDMLVRLNHTDDSKGSEASRKALTHWLQNMMQSRMEEGKAFNVFNSTGSVRSDLIEFIKDISDEKFLQHYDQIMEWLRRPDQPADKFRLALKHLIDAKKQQLVDESAAHLKMLDASGKMEWVTSYWKKLIAKFAEKKNKAKDLDSSTLTKALADPATIFLSKKYDPDTAAVAGELAELIYNNSHFIHASELTLNSLWTMGLVDKVYDAIDRLHRENNTILLSDTNSLIHEIIGEEDAPFVYERLGMHLSNYLIDEFQDTSRMQWVNLTPLVNESHSTGNDNLIIGDEKQCIYRFRNADPTLLGSEVQSTFSPVELSGTTVEDNTNWRSSREVVRFNNTLFQMMLSDQPVGATYDNVIQRVSPKHSTHEGYVSINVFEEDFSKKTLDNMMEAIKRQLKAGYRPCDIAVLTRRATEASEAIERILQESLDPDRPCDFTVISDDSLFVSSSPAVRSIITHLRFLGAADVKASERAMTPRKFSRLFNAYEQTLASRLSDQTDIETASLIPGEVLAEVVAKVQDSDDEDTDSAIPGSEADTVLATDLVVIIERILDTMSPLIRKEQTMYITAFMDLVADYIDSGANDIKSFLKWWDATGCKNKVSSPENDQAIRVMTIHKSKGLEWKCVHVPFCTWPVGNVKGLEWFTPEGLEEIDPDIIPPLIPLPCSSLKDAGPYSSQKQAYVEEETIDAINILYVALTRAVDELIVSISKKKNTVGGMIAEVIPAMLKAPVTDLTQPLFHDPVAENVYYCGAPALPGSIKQKESPEKHQPKALDIIESVKMPDYYILDRSELWADTTVDLPEGYDARTRGMLIHAALTGLRKREDADRALRRMVTRGVITAAQELPLRELLNRELNRPEVRPWFENCKRVLSERSIYIGEDSRTGEDATRRPDRVVWTDEGTIDVIDYKTGELPDDPQELNSLIKRYSRQVKGYMNLINQIKSSDDTSEIRGFIWHLDSSSIFRVN